MGGVVDCGGGGTGDDFDGGVLTGTHVAGDLDSTCGTVRGWGGNENGKGRGEGRGEGG